MNQMFIDIKVHNVLALIKKDENGGIIPNRKIFILKKDFIQLNNFLLFILLKFVNQFFDKYKFIKIIE